MQQVIDIINLINNVKITVKRHIRYIDKILQNDDIESPMAESVEKCYEGLRIIIQDYEALPHEKLAKKDREHIVSDLSDLYHQLDIFKELLQEAIDYDNKRPELAKRRKQALELYQKTTEQQQQELALKLAEAQLQAEQQRAKNLEASILEEQLRQRNNSKNYTLDDLTDIFKTRLDEVTPELLAGDKQKKFADIYNHLKVVLLEANHLSKDEESILTNVVLLKYQDHLEKECIRKLAELEQNPNLSPQNKKIMSATLQSELMKDKAEIRKALDLFRKG